MAFRILSVGRVTVSLRKSEYVIIACLLSKRDYSEKRDAGISSGDPPRAGVFLEEAGISGEDGSLKPV
jgi:hypothetical protein